MAQEKVKVGNLIDSMETFGFVREEALDDYMTWEDYKTDLGTHDDNGEFLKGLDNILIAISGRGDLE